MALNSMVDAGVASTGFDTALHSSSMPTSHNKAYACVDPDGNLVVYLDNRDYQRYYIDEERIASMLAEDDHQNLESVIRSLRIINEREDTYSSIINYICRYQYEFIHKGDPVTLKPLTQAKIARGTGFHRSVICRTIKGIYLSTPHGVFQAIDLLHGIKHVIRRIAGSHPDWTDAQVASHLCSAYNIRITRRTVNYHRLTGNQVLQESEGAAKEK